VAVRQPGRRDERLVGEADLVVRLVPSACARTEARVSSSRAESVSSRPIGPRWTAGGELAGDMPKNRPSRSPNGS
jgi:hypothetical protein